MCSICHLPWATLSNLNQPQTISICTFWVVFSVFGKGMARHLNSVCSLIVASTSMCMVGKGKVLQYSLPRVGPGADPGVQAVSPQVTCSHPPGGRLPLLSARHAVTFPAEERLPIGRSQIILLGDRGTCMWAAWCGPAEIRTRDL